MLDLVIKVLKEEVEKKQWFEWLYLLNLQNKSMELDLSLEAKTIKHVDYIIYKNEINHNIKQLEKRINNEK